MDALSTRHFSSLAVTGGQQPYISLQPAFQQEQMWPTQAAPCFLDAPAFTPMGCHMRYEHEDGDVGRVSMCWPLDGRL